MTAHERLEELYESLKEPPRQATPQWYQVRGRKLEHLLHQLLSDEGLSPRTAYRPDGEEVDGSFVANAHIFLLEAKWHKDPVPASQIYQFKCKVDGKLLGTIGVFLSMSGYAEDAVDALTHGKALNLILFDQADFEACMRGAHDFSTILHEKVRKAAEEGLAYWPYTSTAFVPRRQGKVISSEVEVVPTSQMEKGLEETILVCEGPMDRVILEAIIAAIRPSARAAKIVVANGVLNAPRVAHSLGHPEGDTGRRLVIVVDADGRESEVRRRLQETMGDVDYTAVMPDPSIEAWLERGVPSALVPRLESLPSRRKDCIDAIRNLATHIDVAKLRNIDPAFGALYSTLG